MKILGIESASLVASVAVVTDDTVMAEDTANTLSDAAADD